jgi:hypothetical protein
MTKGNIDKTAEQSFWGQVFSANPQTIVTPDNFDKAMPRPEKLGEGGDIWLTRLFQGQGFYGNPSDKKPSMRRNWRKFLPISITRLPLPQVRC